MQARLRRSIQRAKALLCVACVAELHFLTGGCGQIGLGLPGADTYQIPLSADHPLLQALKGTSFQDAKAIQAYPQSQEFRLIFPDTSRMFGGRFSVSNDQLTITQLAFKSADRTAVITLDENRQITSIITSEGYEWKRSAGSREINDASAAGNDAYIAANADLVEAARSMDEAGYIPSGGPGSPGGGTTGGSGGTTTPVIKGNTADIGDGLRAVLAVLATIWAPLVGVLQPLLTAITAAAIIENVFVLRFDGTWKATNSDANLRIVISNAKIVRMIDEASSNEFTISDSRLARIDGKRVIWTVLARLLGQAADVEFTFDMQELPDGTLQGTLTALGSTFARVPVTMQRL